MALGVGVKVVCVGKKAQVYFKRRKDRFDVVGEPASTFTQHEGHAVECGGMWLILLKGSHSKTHQGYSVRTFSILLLRQL